MLNVANKKKYSSPYTQSTCFSAAGSLFFDKFYSTYTKQKVTHPKIKRPGQQLTHRRAFVLNGSGRADGNGGSNSIRRYFYDTL